MNLSNDYFQKNYFNIILKDNFNTTQKTEKSSRILGI